MSWHEHQPRSQLKLCSNTYVSVRPLPFITYVRMGLRRVRLIGALCCRCSHCSYLCGGSCSSQSFPFGLFDLSYLRPARSHRDRVRRWLRDTHPGTRPPSSCFFTHLQSRHFSISLFLSQYVTSGVSQNAFSAMELLPRH
jgi:hypothetical protein